MNTYQLMCQTSPVQKEWKSKQGDLFWHKWDGGEGVDVCSSNGAKFPKSIIWILRQEDWQEIYQNAKDGGSKHLTKWHPIWLMPDLYKKVYNSKDTAEWILHDGLKKTTKLSEMHDMWWCIFVHKEVYGLVWDWDKKVWSKE